MAAWPYAVLAFAMAASISALELITAKYPRTYFLLFKCTSLYLYTLIYGLIAGLAFFGLDSLVATGQIKLEGLGTGVPWVRALMVGVSAKSLLHINLFNVTVNAQSTPIGVETFTQIFERPLLRSILFYEFNAVRNFLDPYEKKYTDVTKVKAAIIANVPRGLEDDEKKAFEADLRKADNVLELMENGLRFLGKGTFIRAFPL